MRTQSSAAATSPVEVPRENGSTWSSLPTPLSRIAVPPAPVSWAPSRTPVLSSVLLSIGYSSDATLDVEFHNGAIYRYFAVPPAVFAALSAADSKGVYFNLNVRNCFRYQQLSF